MAANAFLALAIINQTSSGLSKKAVTWLMIFGFLSDATVTAMGIHDKPLACNTPSALLLLMIMVGIIGLTVLLSTNQLTRK